MAKIKGQMDKQRSTKRYTESKILSSTNPTKTDRYHPNCGDNIQKDVCIDFLITYFFFYHFKKNI